MDAGATLRLRPSIRFALAVWVITTIGYVAWGLASRPADLSGAASPLAAVVAAVITAIGLVGWWTSSGSILTATGTGITIAGATSVTRPPSSPRTRPPALEEVDSIEVVDHLVRRGVMVSTTDDGGAVWRWRLDGPSGLRWGPDPGFDDRVAHLRTLHEQVRADAHAASPLGART